MKAPQLLILTMLISSALLSVAQDSIRVGRTDDGRAVAGALFNQFRKDEGLQSFDGSTQPSGGIYRDAHQVAAKISRILLRHERRKLQTIHNDELSPL